MSGSGPGTEVIDASVPVSLRELVALREALATREAELLEIRGACRNPKCSLHYAHRGPCR